MEASNRPSEFLYHLSPGGILSLWKGATWEWENRDAGRTKERLKKPLIKERGPRYKIGFWIGKMNPTSKKGGKVAMRDVLPLRGFALGMEG